MLQVQQEGFLEAETCQPEHQAAGIGPEENTHRPLFARGNFATKEAFSNAFAKPDDPVSGAEDNVKTSPCRDHSTETVHLADLARKQSTAVSLQVMSLAETWLDFVGEEGVTARVEGGAVDSTRLSQRGSYSPSVGLFLTCPSSPV